MRTLSRLAVSYVVVVVTAACALVRKPLDLDLDLERLASTDALQLVNRQATALTHGQFRGIRLNPNNGDGVAWLRGLEFADGTIELDMRGADIQGQSFVGVAFHGVDGTTYDAVYFRPFNFGAADTARRSRGVQYISHPTYTWNRLRAEKPAEYERAVTPAVDPNNWFHVRVVVEKASVTVYVGNASQPTLEVQQLSTRGKGLVGLWVGNGSGGDFSNLRIVPRL